MCALTAFRPWKRACGLLATQFLCGEGQQTAVRYLVQVVTELVVAVFIGSARRDRAVLDVSPILVRILERSAPWATTENRTQSIDNQVSQVWSLAWPCEEKMPRSVKAHPALRDPIEAGQFIPPARLPRDVCSRRAAPAGSLLPAQPRRFQQLRLPA